MSTVTDIRMSVTMSRSSMKPGRGVTRAITIASTATGTAISRSVETGIIFKNPPGCGNAFAGVIWSVGESPVHEFEDIGQDFRYRAIQMRRNLLSDIHGFVQRLRQRWVLDDRNVVFECNPSDAQREVIL